MKVWVVQSYDWSHGTNLEGLIAAGGNFRNAMRDAAREAGRCYGGVPDDEDLWEWSVDSADSVRLRAGSTVVSARLYPVTDLTKEA